MLRRFAVFARIIVAVLASYFLVFTGGLSAAAVSPVSGPTTGGTSVTVDGIRFTQISGGNAYTIGLTSEGTVYGWGTNSSGQLGNGSNVSSTTPVQVKGPGGVGYLTGVTKISAGYAFAVALVQGEVFTWGSNYYGQLGNGTNVDSNVPVKVKDRTGTSFLYGITNVEAGTRHALAFSAGQLVSWGLGGQGQLGVNSTSNSNLPVQVRGIGGSSLLTGVTSFTAGSDTSFAIINGNLYSWGWNNSGQLGIGSTTDALVPNQVKGVGGSGFLSGVNLVASGSYHVLASTNSGVFAWGFNPNRQLGDGTTNTSSVPVQVVGPGGNGFLPSATLLTAGNQHSLAVTADGVFSWGANSQGQYGDGTTTAMPYPVQALNPAGNGNLQTPIFVEAHSAESWVIVPDGVYGWGGNFSGALGTADSLQRNLPVLTVNFQPTSLNFGTNPGTALSFSGNQVTAISPAGTAGAATLSGTSSLFAGSTAAIPATVSWNAGTFTYEPALANTGSSGLLPSALGSAGAILLGLVLLVGLRRISKK